MDVIFIQLCILYAELGRLLAWFEPEMRTEIVLVTGDVQLQYLFFLNDSATASILSCLELTIFTAVIYSSWVCLVEGKWEGSEALSEWIGLSLGCLLMSLKAFALYHCPASERAQPFIYCTVLFPTVWKMTMTGYFLLLVCSLYIL